MCLYITSEKLKRLKNKVVDGKITCYKVVENDSGVLCTPYQMTVVKPGWFKAKGEVNKKPHYGDSIIEGGAIHVYTSLKQAQHRAYSRGRKFIKVQCLAKDLVAEGKYSEACFTKIFVPKVEYDKAFK